MNRDDANNEINKSFVQSLRSHTFDTEQDWLELSIDSVFKGEIAQEVPIIKMIVSASKVGLAIRECSFAKKTLNFLYEFENVQVDSEKLADIKLKLERDEEFRDRTMEFIVPLLDKLILEDKLI
ncbi:hypothetical protein COA05_20470 [Bacillus thuringiensis]|uniref:hypothetical protein n=1 Tax=Bacillus thuringiensis TaxID=1428 RepID=UPI000BFE1861|nr:hypothetical protein [Bacillus thuringiensis]PGQ29251.1 hypothetical protein COA05_20470 [Bacillus thuringiensis]